MSDPLSTVQTLYACFGRGDIPALLKLLHDHVEWRFVGDRSAPYSGRFEGTGQVGEWFDKVVVNDDIQAFEPREFLAGPDHVTVLGWERTAAKPGGKVFESEWVHVWRLRDGRVSSFFGIFDTEAAARARA